MSRMSEDYIEEIENRVSEIMYKNREIFPIVECIFKSKDFHKIEEKDTEFYIRASIKNRIGLRYIVRSKIHNTDEIRFTINNIGGKKDNIVKEMENALLRSILLEYIDDNSTLTLKIFNSIV